MAVGLSKHVEALRNMNIKITVHKSGGDKTELLYAPSSITTFIRWFVHDLLEEIKKQGNSCGNAAQSSA